MLLHISPLPDWLCEDWRPVNDLGLSGPTRQHHLLHINEGFSVYIVTDTDLEPGAGGGELHRDTGHGQA